MLISKDSKNEIVSVFIMVPIVFALYYFGYGFYDSFKNPYRLEVEKDSPRGLVTEICYSKKTGRLHSISFKRGIDGQLYTIRFYDDDGFPVGTKCFSSGVQMEIERCRNGKTIDGHGFDARGMAIEEEPDGLNKVLFGPFRPAYAMDSVSAKRFKEAIEKDRDDSAAGSRSK